MLGEIVINHQGVLTFVAEIFAHRSTSIRRKIEQGSRVARTGRHDNRLIHHAFKFEAVNQARNLAELLANGNIDVDNARFLLGLVNHRVDRNSGFTSLAVTNNQLTLTATNREHRIDAHHASHQRLMHRFTTHHTNGRALNEAARFGLNCGAAIEWLTKWTDHATKQFWADWHAQHLFFQRHFLASLDVTFVAEQHGADFVFHQVERKGFNHAVLGFDIDNFAVAHILQAVHPHHAVTDANHDAILPELAAHFEVGDRLTERL